MFNVESVRTFISNSWIHRVWSVETKCCDLVCSCGYVLMCEIVQPYVLFSLLMLSFSFMCDIHDIVLQICFY